MVLELILIAIQHDNYRYRGYVHLLFPFKKMKNEAIVI